MDHAQKLKHLIIISALLIPSIAFSQSAPVGSVDLAGWIKGADGTYSRAFPDNTGTRTAVNSILTTTQQAMVQTSKGLQVFDIDRSSTADIARFGKVVRGLAVTVGPIGMGLGAASLICELTSICDEAGQWLFGESVTEVTSLTCASVGTNTVTYKTPRSGVYNRYKLQPKSQCGGVTPSGWGIVAACSPSVFGCGFGDDMIKEIQGSSTSQASTPHEPTSADWDSKQSLLNDSRFMSTLLDKMADIPIGVPTMTNTPKKVISEDTTITKDQNGNATGTKVTTTEAEIVDAASAESPGRVIVKEKTTVSNYDINNTLINSTTSTSYTNQPPPENPQSFTLSFDEFPENQIEEQEVDADLEAPESWGDGFCPADETINYHYGTLTFDFQPTCDFATNVKPVILFIASITAMFIISGVRVK